MAENLKKRVISQRGASLSMALFVFLVCAMASAAVLAASSAAAGHYIELGKFDQRYYSVISAADLFRGTIADNGEATYTVVETRVNNDENERKSEDLPKSYIKCTKIDPEPSSTFDFLQDVTLFALYGPNRPTTVLDTEVGDSWDELKPFGWSTLLASYDGYSTYSYTIQPLKDRGETVGEFTVKATVRVHDNWLVEVLACNDAHADGRECSDEEKYNLYMAFQGTCNQGDPSISSSLGATEFDANKNVINKVNVEETRTTTVTWKLVRFMPGRGWFA